MPLQNRVNPFGDIMALPQRGTLMGNRGRLHDPETQTLLNRRWALKAWLICVLEFKNRHRAVMGHSYTELFFLDEVTALAAGHRPCFECQRSAAKAYQAAWQRAQKLPDPPKVGVMDPILHKERLVGKTKRLHERQVSNLPDGTVIKHEGMPFALKKGYLLSWHFEGYRPSGLTVNDIPKTVACLTPPSTLAVLSDGYHPLWHDSAHHQSS